MTRSMTEAFNEWMRRYIDDPEAFYREWQTVNGFIAETSADAEPSYGETCSAYIEQLMSEEVTATA